MKTQEAKREMNTEPFDIKTRALNHESSALTLLIVAMIVALTTCAATRDSSSPSVQPIVSVYHEDAVGENRQNFHSNVEVDFIEHTENFSDFHRDELTQLAYESTHKPSKLKGNK